MIVGYIIIGTIVGLCASGISVMLGASLWWAFAAYIGVGNITILLVAAICARHCRFEKPQDAADHDFLGNRNLKPSGFRHPMARPAHRNEPFNPEGPQPTYARSVGRGE